MAESEPNDSAATANAASVGDDVSGALSGIDGDSDWVSFALGVTVFTIRAHLRSIFAKLGVRRQVALVRAVITGTDERRD